MLPPTFRALAEDPLAGFRTFMFATAGETSLVSLIDRCGGAPGRLPPEGSNHRPCHCPVLHPRTDRRGCRRRTTGFPFQAWDPLGLIVKRPD